MHPSQKKAPRKLLELFTVFAIYKDNHQRYTTTVQAENADQAEVEAQNICREDNKFPEHYEPLIIAAVVKGRHYPVDRCPVYAGRRHS